MLSFILLASLFAILVRGADSETTTIYGRSVPLTAFQNADGSVNRDMLRAESARVSRKWNNRSAAPVDVLTSSISQTKKVNLKRRSAITNAVNTYFGGVSIGTPAQVIQVILDTGSSITSTQFDGQPYTGLLGLAFTPLANNGDVPFVQNLVNQKSLPQNLFSFYLNQAGDGSTLVLGNTDPKYGTIAYTPVTSRTYWEVQSGATYVNGVNVPTSFASAIDTGTTLVYVPTVTAVQIFNALPGATIDTTDSSSSGGTTYYKYPCATINNIKISLTFAGNPTKYTIYGPDLNLGTTSFDSTQCVLSIAGMNFAPGLTGGDIAIVGDVFLKSVYSVFSFDALKNAPAVGFAALKF